MTPHEHRTFVEGCYRCELGRDEARDAASIEDVRWRLESAMEKLDSYLLTSALDLIVEAGEVVEAMHKRMLRERAEINRKHREAHRAQ